MKKKEMVDDFIEILGVDATVKLLAEFGGTQLYISPNLRAKSSIQKSAHIEELIGPEAYATLVRYYSGLITIPRGSSIIRQHKIKECHRLLDVGLTYDEVAMRLKVHRKTVGLYAKIATSDIEQEQANAGLKLSHRNLKSLSVVQQSLF